MAVRILMAIHKAIDFFFCDRCPIEVIDGRLSDCFSHFCPFARIWDMDFLPREKFNYKHPIYFPRTYLLEMTKFDQGLQKLGPDKYGQ